MSHGSETARTRAFVTRSPPGSDRPLRGRQLRTGYGSSCRGGVDAGGFRSRGRAVLRRLESACSTFRTPVNASSVTSDPTTVSLHNPLPATAPSAAATQIAAADVNPCTLDFDGSTD